MKNTLNVTQLASMLNEWEMTINCDRAVSVDVREAHQNVINIIRDEMRGLECDECADPWTERREAGNFCRFHALQFVKCDGCHRDVLFSDAVTPVTADGGFYHADCVGRDENAEADA